MRTWPPTPFERRDRLRAVCVLVGLCAWPPALAQGQGWPERPVVLADNRVTLGGDVTLTVGSDDEGYFNYTDYERSALRLVRLGLLATFRANAHLSGLVEVRAEGDSAAGQWSGDAYAAYVRVTPWAGRAFELHAGRVPTAFGGFSRRPYGNENLLIGYPLAYQYLTSLRADAVPRSADDLVAMRGRGWYAYYPVGADYWEHGVPAMNVFRYDTGLVAKLGTPSSPVDLAASVTAGTLANPRLDDNGAPQVAARLAVRPMPGVAIGVSGARGAFLEQSVREVLPATASGRQYRQRAFGTDVEVSRDYWLVRTEIVTTDWRLPALEAPLLDRPLRATFWLTEGRYKLAPGWYAAARYDRAVFSEVQSSRGLLTWDANVWRIEAGAGYSLRRNIVVKGSYQYDRREGGFVRAAHLGAAQVALWF